MKRSVCMQLKVLLQRKSPKFVFIVLICIVLLNYLNNVFTYEGMDVVAMYHPMKLLLLSSYGGLGFYFMQCFPLLVIIPAGFSYFADYSTQTMVQIQSRVGIKNYYYGKLLSVFILTFIIFTIPFIMEILLNCIAFPLQAIGDPSEVSVYDHNYIESVRQYLFSDLFRQSPYLHAFISTLLFGVISGLLAVFTTSISMLKIKYKLFLFLPVYLLLYGGAIIGQISPFAGVNTNYFAYLRIHDGSPKNPLIFVCTLVLTLSISALILKIKLKKVDY